MVVSRRTKTGFETGGDQSHGFADLNPWPMTVGGGEPPVQKSVTGLPSERKPVGEEWSYSVSLFSRDSHKGVKRTKFNR